MSYEELYNKVKEEKGEELDQLIDKLSKELLEDESVMKGFML